MDLKQVYQLMDKFEQSNLTNFEYRDQDFEIQMGKKGHGKPVVTTQPTPMPNVPAASAAPVAPTPEPVSTPAVSAAAPTPVSTPALAPTEVTIDPADCITAPVVGIFYQAHSSEEAPYVSVGDQVSVGQQVGLIQAMQMMRPVVAKQAGQVKALLVKNGDEVNFGQPLIQLVPDEPSEI
ncbi:biotin/lipoyl-containing protein [Lactiplantibacillus sp. WILCCON 0030]|uniref:Biotin carboxyl carrier protein of acetyl-CoA carboxylase n=1 Tax=Lactiplantibacillus brownii TaxID=3069269 RepID=A0ABU1A5X3_9LACO|nr:biotin/lipoyl-containing protein [Lactiplantibacillus brownii]MDQ7936359.1 biotin/lipoyl-containing protein [Lactiplantibacillus brownii]